MLTVGGQHLLHDVRRATCLQGGAEGAGGRVDHQHGAGGPVSNAVHDGGGATWLQGVAEGPGGHGDHQHGAGGPVLNTAHDGGRTTWIQGVVEGAGGRGDHQHGAGGPVHNAVLKWKLKEKEGKRIKRELGPPCTYLNGHLMEEERGPPMTGLRGRSAPPLDMRKPRKIENEVMLSSSSSGRLCQEVKENKNQEAGRVTNHHHQEDKRVYRESNSSSSLFNTNLCTNRLTRDRTYRGSGAPEIGTGSWQHPAALSTSPRAS